MEKPEVNSIITRESVRGAPFGAVDREPDDEGVESYKVDSSNGKGASWVAVLALAALLTGCSFGAGSPQAQGSPAPVVGAGGLEVKAAGYYVEPKLAHGQKTLPEKGFLAPNLMLTTTTGKTINLYQELALGKPVFLNFFATWCPPCRAEMPTLVQGAHRYGKNVTFLAVNPTPSESSPSAVPAFIRQYKIPYPVMLDTTGTVTQAWFVSGLPTSFLIAPNGVILSVNQGPIANMQSFLQQAYVGGKIVSS